MPPDACNRAVVAAESGLKNTIEHHSWQRLAGLASNKTGTRGLGPDLEQLFRGDLIGGVPVRNARCCGCGQDLEGDLDVLLELHALPVFDELLGASLNLERRVVILAIG